MKPIEKWTIKKNVGGPHEDEWAVWDHGSTVVVSNETAGCHVATFPKESSICGSWQNWMERFVYMHLRGEVTKRIMADGKERLYPTFSDWYLSNYHFPLYGHDCTSCRYLGRYKEEVGEVDLYWCGKEGRSFNLISMLARFGNEGSEYASSNPPLSVADPIGYLKIAQGWYHECLRRARMNGLIPDSEWEKIVPLYLTVRLALPAEWDAILPTTTKTESR